LKITSFKDLIGAFRNIFLQFSRVQEELKSLNAALEIEQYDHFKAKVEVFILKEKLQWVETKSYEQSNLLKGTKS